LLLSRLTNKSSGVIGRQLAERTGSSRETTAEPGGEHDFPVVETRLLGGETTFVDR